MIRCLYYKKSPHQTTTLVRAFIYRYFYKTTRLSSAVKAAKSKEPVPMPIRVMVKSVPLLSPLASMAMVTSLPSSATVRKSDKVSPAVYNESIGSDSIDFCLW